ncbi:MAG: ABC transporter ATP-binding protein, partial [Elusimicrobia bacterium RIFCSPLOWO2_01_FULL_59_12]
MKTPRAALRGVTFSVRPGEVFGLLGPNGGGKTTAFHILSTVFAPTSGRALIFGIDVAQNPAQVRKQLGVVFQAPSLDRKLTIQENVRHQGHLYGLRGDDLTRRSRRVLERVGLWDRRNDRVEVLSGGLKRRVELAKGLLHRPGLLILDEPSTGLDPGARRDLWDYLKELKEEEGMTLLLTTHLMDEADRCDRVAILNEGLIVALGTPVELKRDIGGDVITVETPDPENLRSRIESKFSAASQVVDGSVRIERQNGHEFIPQLVGAFPGLLTAVTLGKPTLEDVFIKKTGHRFWTTEASPPNPSP